MALDTAHVVNLTVAGILVGNELATWAVVHRAVMVLPVPGQVMVEQALTRRCLRIMPVLMSATIASAVAVLVLLPAEGSAFWLTVAGTACFTAMLAVTLVANMPLNAVTLRTSPDVDQAEWQRVRGRWNALHSARVLLDVTGFVLLVSGLVARS